MRILFLAGAISEDLPGVSRVVARESVCGLAVRGHDVTILAGRQTPEARVCFTGSVPLMDLPGYLNAMDAPILPSRTTATWKEQFGRVLIEAGACGLPVVGSDSGAIPEVIANAGLTFPEGDAPALADRLQTLLDHPERRAEYGRIGQTRAVDLFSWPQVAGRMRDIYSGLLR